MCEATKTNEKLSKIASFIANTFHDDIAEGGAQKLTLTNIHHSDAAPNCVSIELMNGDVFFVMVAQGWVP